MPAISSVTDRSLADQGRRPLGYGVYGGDGVAGNDRRHDRAVGDPEPADAVHLAANAVFDAGASLPVQKQAMRGRPPRTVVSAAPGNVSLVVP